jgi:hypothetical protein
MITYYQFNSVYPSLTCFSRSEKDNGSLIKGGTYLGTGAIAGKATLDSAVPRLLGARLERHSTSKEGAKKILESGGYLNASKSNKGSMRLLETPPSWMSAEMAAERLQGSKNYNYITGYHPDAKIGIPDLPTQALPNVPVRNVIYRKFQGLTYRAQSAIDYDKQKTLEARKAVVAKNTFPAMVERTGKTLFIPVTDKEVATKFVPDIDDPIAIRTKKPVKVYGNRVSATLAHLRKNGLKQIAANPGRVGAGAVILGAGGAIAVPLINRGYAEVKAFKRKGKLVKAHRRILTSSQ